MDALHPAQSVRILLNEPGSHRWSLTETLTYDDDDYAFGVSETPLPHPFHSHEQEFKGDGGITIYPDDVFEIFNFNENLVLSRKS